MSELQFGRWVPRRTDTQQIRDLVARRNALAFGDLGVGDLLIEGHFDDRFTAEVERHRKVLEIEEQIEDFQLAAPGRLAATTFGAPSTAIQRKLPQDRASASDSSKYIRAYQSLLFTANRHDHAYRCRRSDRVLLVLHGHLHIGPPPILAQKHAPSCGWRGGSGLVTTHRAGLTNCYFQCTP